MLFDKRFKKYEDLLEFEAIQRGRAEGLRLALQDALETTTSDSRDALPAGVDEKISAADVQQLRRWLKLLHGGVKPGQLFAGH